MKKVFVLFTVVMLMAVMAWEKQSGKPVESEFLLDNVEALASGESSTTNRYQTMGYCAPLNMNYMCTSRRTAESCRRPCR
ncbi:hypothetical protein GAS36_10385 [Phocaeicola vulgatus]|uniref:NVEALA protein n=1 Tax=Phocaeicola vulgatus TaxID=821 RepID=A0A6I0IF38_PHOVU|nr:hypothetical protein GAS29_11670 [Phocaeicola vulgatus]KAB3857121.1 hypothetical protein GAS17_11550 [Phocaeicola vulgatus]KAB3866375.1 hypothetical protein GAS07_12720 [Phocaeicola vulgatus]KAB3869313.1 hypothetical protein GAS14_11505 [Phocaeicola vulgatus]KAB3880348.1 hypothetical protein GAS24_11155 [Phocaeicola vulgatus]